MFLTTSAGSGCPSPANRWGIGNLVTIWLKFDQKLVQFKGNDSNFSFFLTFGSELGRYSDHFGRNWTEFGWNLGDIGLNLVNFREDSVRIWSKQPVAPLIVWFDYFGENWSQTI